MGSEIKQLNKGLILQPKEIKFLKHFFGDTISTTSKNIHRLLDDDESSEYADNFIHLCEVAIEEGIVSTELHAIIKDDGFYTRLITYSQKTDKAEGDISPILSYSLIKIIDRLRLQLPGLKIVGNIAEQLEKEKLQQLKSIVNSLKGKNIAYNIFDDGTDNSTVKFIQNTIQKKLKKKHWKQAYKLVHEFIYNNDSSPKQDVPYDWNKFVKSMYSKAKIEMPEEEVKKAHN